jgi:hypothetical protein
VAQLGRLNMDGWSGHEYHRQGCRHGNMVFVPLPSN